MYAAFGAQKDLTPYEHLKPLIDINEMNKPTVWGAKESLAMDFSDVDLTPTYELNVIVWKRVKSPDSPMPPPVRSFHFASRQSLMPRPAKPLAAVPDNGSGGRREPPFLARVYGDHIQSVRIVVRAFAIDHQPFAIR
jgi:hypothetical protein